ncbi:uncharacterized protein M6B38_292335 [Iris pallida]|uniref:PB1 domain-containing protein n=1 Tax=Iris pallida TaxID=29817 RepID=A0AAX6HUZ7_IRIPA|nr:uncharacterized protein M6B38_292335 [Iris pallida]
MVTGTIVAFCQFGGEFVTKDDGTMLYTDGEAHAVNINDDLKSEIASMFNIDSSTICIKYFLPINKRTLITVSSEKNLGRMIDFHMDSLTIDIYVSNKNENRTTRSIAADSGTSVVDTAAADRSCRSKRPNTANRMTTRSLKARTCVADSSSPTSAICKRGTTSVADSSTRKTASGKTTDNVKQKRSRADEKTVVRRVVDDSVAPVAINPAIDNNTQERVILDSIDEANEANMKVEISFDTADDIGSQLSTNHFDTCITDVGQELENVRAFCDELCKYAFSKGFPSSILRMRSLVLLSNAFQKIVHGGYMLLGQLVSKNLLSRKQIMCIHVEHNLGKILTAELENCGWLGLRKKVFDNPDGRPRDTARNVYEEFGVHLSYPQAWTAKEIAQKEIHTVQEEACNQVPWLCEQIMGANPGTVATVATSVDAKFRRCFVSFYASFHGFENGCRPLIFLDKKCLTVNNLWKLLVAASVDGDNEIFPVAFAIVEEETPDSWHWFLLQLKYAITSQRVTIVSSRQKGLDESVPRVFEDCYHGYSLVHLIEEYKAVLKKAHGQTNKRVQWSNISKVLHWLIWLKISIHT